MVECVRCTPAHLAAVERYESTPDTRDNLLTNPWADEILATYARALVEGETVLGVVGVLPLYEREGVGYAFAMLSAKALGRGLSLSKATKAALEYAVRELGFTRIEAAVKADYEAGNRWIQWLGFKYVGPFKPDEYADFGICIEGDYALYAREA